MSKILDDGAYASHQRARIKFEAYLSESERNGLNESWKSYYNYKYGGHKSSTGSLDARNKETPNAIEIIEEILRYAKNK